MKKETIEKDRNVNPVLKEILETQSIERPDGGTSVLKHHIPTEEGEFLQQIVAEAKLRTSIEIGLGYGISTHYICDVGRAIPGFRHIVIDPSPLGVVGFYNLEKAGYGALLEFHRGPSHVVLPKLVEQGRKVDFAFIDGQHTFDHVLVDFFYIDKLLKVGGIVAFDDCTFPSIYKVCCYIARNQDYCLVGHVRQKGIRLVRRLRSFLSRMASLSPFLFYRWFKYGEFELARQVPRVRCLAFRKESENGQKSFYQEF